VSESICHRAASGLSFAGVEIHAAEGVHEGALAILRQVLPPGTRVADLGAGSGAFSVRLKSAGYEPVAVDLKVDVRPEGINFLEADVTDLSSVFEPGSLPAVAAIELMEHLHDPIRFLQSVFRVLEPGGVFLATTPNVTHPYSKLKFLTRGTFFWFTPELYWESGHTTPLPEWLLRAHLDHAGFKDIKHGFIGNFGDYPAAKRMLIKAMSRRLGGTGVPLGVDGDGGNLVILGRKPSVDKST
jgi:SAM-dependent methyltransferase